MMMLGTGSPTSSQPAGKAILSYNSKIMQPLCPDDFQTVAMNIPAELTWCSLHLRIIPLIEHSH